MDVVQWLQKIGFEKYLNSFLENNIDQDVLLELTDSDLKELGVSALGDRKKILNAISNLKTDDSRKTSKLADPIETAVKQNQSTQNKGERRQLTVMFCDMVGSTEISNRLDPEELRELMRQYQDAVAGCIARYDGYLAKFLGDGILAYFGWPQAFEDQAERAIRAGIEVIDAVSQINHDKGIPLQSRVGIATGEVVIGDIVGETSAQSEAVIGETPNRAARLQTLAQPNQLIIGDVTKKLVGDLFVLEELGEKSLKGIPDPVSVWRVVKKKVVDTRFEAAHHGELGDFIGREHELGLLKERWSLSKLNEGQVVIVTGDAGIGKSRLIGELRNVVSQEPHFRMRYQCSPHHINTAFHPIIKRMERAAGMNADDSTDKKLDKLETLIGPSSKDVQENAAIFANLLSIESDRYKLMEHSAQQLRVKTIKIIIEQISTLSDQKPVLFIMEDVHWIDPSTEELLGELIPSIHEKAIYILLTTRPNYTLPWIHHSHVTSIDLRRLSRDQVINIISETGGNKFPESVIERIVERADGIPLFVEELTSAVIDSGQKSDDLMNEDLVPATLQASLLARIDRLNEAKEIAQIGAILGREFSYELLSAVADKTETELNEALRQLVNSGTVFKRGVPPESIYTFKHSLLQDAAYTTLLISRRQQLHKTICEILEDQSDDKIIENVELIAHHALQAEDWEKAYEYLQRAGLKALDRSANQEAVAFLEKALACLVHRDEGREKVKESVDLHFNLRSALQALGEHQQVFEHLLNAESLAEELGDKKRLGWANSYLSQYFIWMGKHGEAEKAGQTALSIASEVNDISLEAVTNFFIGQGLFNIGDYRRANESFQKNTSLLKGDLAFERLGLTGLPSVLSLSWWTWSLLELGEFDEAMTHAQGAWKIAKSANQPYSMASASLAIGEVYLSKREPEAAQSVLQTALDLCQEWDLKVIYPMAAANFGLCKALNGSFHEALSLLEDGNAKKQSVQIFETPMSATALGFGYLMAGKFKKADSFAQEVLKISKERGFRGSQASTLNLIGKIKLQSANPDTASAIEHYNQALSLAKQLEMRPLIADCYHALTKLYQGTDKNMADVFNTHAKNLCDELKLEYERNNAVLS